jgi:hypothetical protein
MQLPFIKYKLLFKILLIVADVFSTVPYPLNSNPYLTRKHQELNSFCFGCLHYEQLTQLTKSLHEYLKFYHPL